MLDLINSLADGFVAVPVIDACRRHGLFRILAEHPAITVEQLLVATTANAGPLRVALRLLVESGWAEQTGRDAYRLGAAAEAVEQWPADVHELIHLSMSDALRDPAGAALQRWLSGSPPGTGEASPVELLLNGAMLAPLLVEIDRLGGAALLEAPSHPDISGPCQAALRRHFVARGWGSGQGARFELNPAGHYVLQSGPKLGVVVSYRPMLCRMDDLLFGAAAEVFGRDASGHERHLDRELNVTGSGSQHQSYFEALVDLLVDVFDQEPLDAQPRYIADMGCGDGTLLRQVYEAIQKRTRRGQALADHPLQLIGIDLNERALQSTARTLAGTPHHLVVGDIGDPRGLIATLRERGITDPHSILHIRSFLDHDCSPRSPQDAAAVEDKRRLPLTGVYMGRDGSNIEPAVALQGLVEHLGRWREVVPEDGLAMLEVHCLRPATARTFGARTGALHFDAYHGFSGQQLFEAPVFMMAAAEAGLFPDRASFRRFPGAAPFTRITLNRWCARSYRLRHPAEADVPRLHALERASWPAHLVVSPEELRRRIATFAQGQFAIEQDGRIVAALYTQRTDAVESLRQASFAGFARLHQPDGALVHLLGCCVLPEMQGLGLADELIDFALAYFATCDGVETVAGVTRCHDYGRHRATAGSMDHYIRQRDPAGQLVEPMLRFHTSHGAVVHGIVPGFRPEDVANDGAGVLIEYPQFRVAAAAAGERPRHVPPRQAVRQAPSAALGKRVRDIVEQVLGQQRAAAYALQRPLMEMGLGSADLLELRHRLSERIGVALDATFFFRCGTPQAIIEHLADDLQARGMPADGDVVEPALPQQNAAEGQAPATVDPQAPVELAVAAQGDIAIVGVACRFPGGVSSPEEFWDLLLGGVDAIGPRADLSRPRDAAPGPRRVDRHGGFITGVDQFDAPFFRISPREAELMDPQHRLLLEVVWEALERAGIAPSRLRGSDAGVFVGVMGHDYGVLLRQEGRGHDADPHFATGNAASIAAGRIAYYFDWHGPAVSVDTACSSSLVATHLACKSLLAGECSQAVAAGVNLLLHAPTFDAYERAGMLSPDGRCRTFDAAANGYVRGEGCGAVVLKRWADAQRDGDTVWAVIRGSAINQDGASAGLTAPNQWAQQAVIEAALAQGGIAPHEVKYLEAHGTGTSLGDPIEVQAAAAALGGGRGVDEPLLLGSVKTNLGHLEAAAGMAGLIKVVLSMQRGVIPRHLHLVKPNPHVDWARLPVKITTESQPWPGGRKLAGVSSFGFSGTNAHVILEAPAAMSQASAIAVTARRPALIVLSAKNEPRLREQAQRLRAAIATGRLTQADLSDVAYTLQVGREAMEFRLALAAVSLQELDDKLARFLAGGQGIDNLWHGNVEGHRDLLDAFAADEDMVRTIDTWVEKSKFGKLLEWWVKGLAFDWERLQGPGRPRRISLPTYPFARERYWVPEDPDEALDRGERSSAWLHPLVHRNTSDLTGQRYSTRLSAQAFFLREHVVRGERVVPGVVQLEWARAAVRLALGEGTSGAIRLEQVNWVRPLVVSTELDVHIALSAEEDGRIGFEIYSGEGEQEQLYSQGWARELSAATRGDAPRVDLGALQAQCTRTISRADCYARFEQQGLGYGPSFQVLTQVQAGDAVGLGMLQSPANADQQDHAWPPSLMDGALQACLALDTTAHRLALPFSVQAVEQWAEVPQEAVAVVRPARDDSAAVRKFDVEIADAQGRVAIRFSGFSTRVIEASQVAQTLLLTPRWQAQAVPEEGACTELCAASGGALRRRGSQGAGGPVPALERQGHAGPTL